MKVNARTAQLLVQFAHIDLLRKDVLVGRALPGHRSVRRSLGEGGSFSEGGSRPVKALSVPLSPGIGAPGESLVCPPVAGN